MYHAMVHGTVLYGWLLVVQALADTRSISSTIVWLRDTKSLIDTLKSWTLGQTSEPGTPRHQLILGHSNLDIITPPTFLTPLNLGFQNITRDTSLMRYDWPILCSVPFCLSASVLVSILMLHLKTVFRAPGFYGRKDCRL